MFWPAGSFLFIIGNSCGASLITSSFISIVLLIANCRSDLDEKKINETSDFSPHTSEEEKGSHQKIIYPKTKVDFSIFQKETKVEDLLNRRYTIGGTNTENTAIIANAGAAAAAISLEGREDLIKPVSEKMDFSSLFSRPEESAYESHTDLCINFVNRIKPTFSVDEKGKRVYEFSQTKLANYVKPPKLLQEASDLKEVAEAFSSQKDPSHMSILEKGEYYYLTNPKSSNVVFQTDKSLKEISYYVNTASEARKICQENNLFLLYIPYCEVLESDPHILIQENLELLDDQKIYYQWILHYSDLQAYAEELFFQLAQFICIMGFYNVDYSTIQLMKDGRVALFNIKIDDSMKIRGLVTGDDKNGRKGLFNIMPPGYITNLVARMEEHIPDDFPILSHLVSKLESAAKKREQRLNEIAKYCDQRKIFISSQTLIFKAEIFNSVDLEILAGAQIIIGLINEQLKTMRSISLILGRKVTISLENATAFSKSFLDSVESSLETLKDAGYLFSYKVKKTQDNTIKSFSVIC